MLIAGWHGASMGQGQAWGKGQGQAWGKGQGQAWGKGQGQALPLRMLIAGWHGAGMGQGQALPLRMLIAGWGKHGAGASPAPTYDLCSGFLNYLNDDPFVDGKGVVMSTNLSMTHLRFDCVARESIKLGGAMAGDRLRNGLASVMLRSVCPVRERGREPTPEHAAICPACWLLAANVDPGEVRRAYSLVPPFPPRDVVEVGESFSFVLTLFGEGQHFLPYFVLAVPEMGAGGVGPGRGQFALSAIWAADPFTRQLEPVLSPGEQTIYFPERVVSWAGVDAFNSLLLSQVQRQGQLKVRFLTPTRLVTGNSLVKVPDFGVFFQRLLHRVDQLGQQFAGEGRRSYEEIMALQTVANRVRLVDSQVRWVDLFSWSGRTRKKSPIGGFVGMATYAGEQWELLLPWLLWGQATQVGKLTVKGNGLFEVGSRDGYWRWMFGDW